MLERTSAAGRLRGAVLAGLVVGVVSGGGATWWWIDSSPDEVRTSSAPAAGSGELRLVLDDVVAPSPRGGASGTGPAPLLVDAVLLHDRGPGSATVTRIHRPGGSLAIRVPALPAELSVNNSSERIRLELRPRDCELAVQWTPSSQPFTITWSDDHGEVHHDLGGDHEARMEVTMIGYLQAACRAAVAR